MSGVVEINLEKINQYVDDHKEIYIQRLSEAVAIQSVSTWHHTRNEIFKMMAHVEKVLASLGASVEKESLGLEQKFADNKSAPYPHVILAEIKSNIPNAKTLLIYGHLDVQPARIEDGWDSEPFVLTEKDGKLFGRGSSDDKGPVICWLNMVEAYKNCGIELPINLKFCFEGMEESDSEGLPEIIEKRSGDFFNNVDFACISDNYWLGTKKPCLTYGLRGVICFELEIKCAKKDLHSGVYGGTVNEAMTDLVHIMSQLVNPDGKIQIPGIYDKVDPLTKEESALYTKIDFDLDEFIEEVGCKTSLHDKTRTLMQRWRYPSLSFHGIEGAFYEPGCKTVIPARVIGKFSIRTVPYMDHAEVVESVKKYVTNLHACLNSSTEMKFTVESDGAYWLGKVGDKNFEAASMATKDVYHIEPDLTREGGSIPVALDIEKATNSSVVLLPVGRSNDGAHSQNEKIDIVNYINGVKLFASYVAHLGN